MKVQRYQLIMEGLEVEARIGIHDFERQAPQRLRITIEIDIEPHRLPAQDSIEATFDYDWVRDTVKALLAGRHFDLQETLVRTIVDALGSRPEIARVVVQTAKPDVYPDVAAVGCRVEASR